MGYAQSLLVMKRFGYPDFITASADELVGAQYEDRPALRPVYDAVSPLAGCSRHAFTKRCRFKSA